MLFVLKEKSSIILVLEISVLSGKNDLLSCNECILYQFFLFIGWFLASFGTWSEPEPL